MTQLYTVPAYTLADILGESLSREEALALIQSDEEAFSLFKPLSDASKDKLLSFIQGNTGLKILNDKCFPKIMSPELHPNRLNSMLSAILGETVRVHAILPRKGDLMVEEGSFVIMDLLVELENGTIINVEVQRVGYLFPGARSCCYLSDLIMRQYSKVRSMEGKEFSYNHMRPTILIVLMERSSNNFAAVSPHYIHREQISYDSGAAVKTLTNTIYISLDTFHSFVQNISTELDAWLTFLGSDAPADIVKLVNAYPEFMEYYKDIVEFRRDPRELMHMYSEALRQMDRNMEKYMVDEMRATIKECESTIKERESTIKNQQDTICSLQAQLDAALAEISVLKSSK